ncbi:TlpA disulfide reductase family protein [Candidatus Endowatersipora endosymbiont of Watersipora subatra]|uniref:TlpA family protein disulfide reductase n=1 Tax=Candidatus Endowatersipora endosymbiont of Watersipora subatra TaxID=3077946 RepID=UPI00312CC0AE
MNTNITIKSRIIWYPLLASLIGFAMYSLLPEKSNDREAPRGTCTIDENKNQSLKASAIGKMAAFQGLDSPYSVQDLSFRNAQGNHLTIADWHKRTVLFNIWAMWCVPCRKEIPALNRLQEKLGSKEFEVLAVNIDRGDPDQFQKFYQSIGLKDLELYHDPTLKTLDFLKKSGLFYGLPVTLLIDGRGCVSGFLNGPADWDSDDAIQLIMKQMKN